MLRSCPWQGNTDSIAFRHPGLYLLSLVAWVRLNLQKYQDGSFMRAKNRIGSSAKYWQEICVAWYTRIIVP